MKNSEMEISIDMHVIGKGVWNEHLDRLTIIRVDREQVKEWVYHDDSGVPDKQLVLIDTGDESQVVVVLDDLIKALRAIDNL